METQYKDLLYTFLKEQKVFYRYKAYFEAYRGDLPKFLTTTAPVYYIKAAFLFDNTDEGYAFWTSINDKWVKVLDKYQSHKFKIVIKMNDVKTDIFETKKMFDDLLKSKDSSYEITIEKI